MSLPVKSLRERFPIIYSNEFFIIYCDPANPDKISIELKGDQETIHITPDGTDNLILTTSANVQTLAAGNQVKFVVGLGPWPRPTI